MIEIIQKGDEVLREQAQPVPVDAIQTPKIQKIIADMKEAMHSQNDAVAIAAPQIAVPLRIFIISGRVFESNDININKEHTGSSDMVFINPKITKLSQKKEWVEEGCLSVRWWYGEVYRAKKC